MSAKDKKMDSILPMCKKAVLRRHLRDHKQSRWVKLLCPKAVMLRLWRFVRRRSGASISPQAKKRHLSTERHYAIDGQCLKCGAWLYSRPRLIHHLNQGTTDCLAWSIANAKVLSLAEIARLDDVDQSARRDLTAQGLRETQALKPALPPAYVSVFQNHS